MSTESPARTLSRSVEEPARLAGFWSFFVSAKRTSRAGGVPFGRKAHSLSGHHPPGRFFFLFDSTIQHLAGLPATRRRESGGRAGPLTRHAPPGCPRSVASPAVSLHSLGGWFARPAATTLPPDYEKREVRSEKQEAKSKKQKVESEGDPGKRVGTQQWGKRPGKRNGAQQRRRSQAIATEPKRNKIAR